MPPRSGWASSASGNCGGCSMSGGCSERGTQKDAARVALWAIATVSVIGFVAKNNLRAKLVEP